MRRMFLCVSLFPVLSACQDEFVEDADLNQEGAVALSDGTLKIGKNNQSLFFENNATSV